MNIAIIVAAGSGQRFAREIPKQFVPIHGKPLIRHTLERFEACPAIDEIILVLSESGRAHFQISNFGSEIGKLRSIVIGGASRAESVRNGLDSFSASDDDIVAVHDGARPLVSIDEITKTVEKAVEIGAACLVGEVNDTIKDVDEGMIRRTICRGRLRRALTPQAFRYIVLKRAFEHAELNEAVTDECYLVERLGAPIAAVEGSVRNIKVTRADDLAVAELYLSEVEGQGILDH